MDADLQDDPAEIPDLYNMVADGTYDLVSGWKARKDRIFTKNILHVRQRYSQAVTVQLHDMNRGLKRTARSH